MRCWTRVTSIGLRKPVRQILRAGDWTTEPGSGSILQVTAGRLFRRDRLGTRVRLARERLIGGASFCAAAGKRGAADAAHHHPRELAFVVIRTLGSAQYVG
jgi:hypothetical protein